MDAGDLRPGDELLSLGGAAVRVEGVRLAAYDDLVYNVEVDDLHTYAVGRAGVLAHNTNGEGAGEPAGGANAPNAQQAKGGTYKLVDPETGQVVRTGRTKNLAQREGQHARDPELSDYKFEVDRRTDKYAQQRGREQIIHDQYDPPLNKIRPIRPDNPNRQKYLDAGKELE